MPAASHSQSVELQPAPSRFGLYTEINDNIRHWDERCTVIGIACASGVYGAYVLALLVLLRVI
jgi:hypothetical protein